MFVQNPGARASGTAPRKNRGRTASRRVRVWGGKKKGGLGGALRQLFLEDVRNRVSDDSRHYEQSGEHEEVVFWRSPERKLTDRWEYPFFHECFPDREEVRIVDCEHLNRDPADGCPSSEFSRPPLEMPTPLVLPRMEQADQFASGWIPSGNIGALVPVAVKAGQGKV